MQLAEDCSHQITSKKIVVYKHVQANRKCRMLLTSSVEARVERN